MSNLKPIIEESFIQYSGAVLQNRALIDVRDGLKPSARQILYCMYKNKYLHSKPFQPTPAPIGDAIKTFYKHGNTSALGIIMRAAQPFSMRYPLVEVRGNAGTLISSGGWAADRYTKSRLSALGEYIFQDINKDTITEWREGIDETQLYPAVVPSKGFSGICNGSTGIGIGMASSVPQYNLKEMNQALEHLLLNPECEFEEIYIAPDFATGAILLNEDEVKNSMKQGTGFACKLRSVVDYDKKENCFIVTEIPYGVYTSTICQELEAIVNSEDNPGIDRPGAKNGEQAIVDSTGKTPRIKIYLAKKANPNKVLKYLYKNTSLQSHYGINFTMLDMGRFPKVFTWKEMLQAHIDHEKEVYRRGFEFDLKKITDRLHIIDGLLICLANIDEVVHIIKSSTSSVTAAAALKERFLLDDAQTKAILDMKLSRLAHLEVKKLTDEKEELERSAAHISQILSNIDLFNQELINGWREVSQKFGDERRTRILNISKENEEPRETQELLINLSNQNNIYITTVSTLYSQKRGGVGNKFKMSKGEYVISTASGTNLDTLLFFSNEGNCYHTQISDLPFEEVIPIESLCSLNTTEHIKQLAFLNRKDSKEHIIFFTKKGILKKSKLSDYNTKMKIGVKALNLDEGDEICSILLMNDERVGMLTARGQFVMCETKDIRAIGRIARGVKGITLNSGDSLVSAQIIPSNVKELLTISEFGFSKRTSFAEFNVTGRATKGVKIQTLRDGDSMIEFAPIVNQRDMIVVSSNSQIKFNIEEINLLSKGAQGTKSIKLTAAKVIGLQIF